MTTHDEQASKIGPVLDAVKQHLDAAELKHRLNKCSPSIITHWKDEDSFDLLHHCILHRNISALILLLSRGFFKSPYEPAVWPYLHLVACMGQRSFISCIIQELKFHNEPAVLDWVIFNRTIRLRIKDFIPKLEDADKNRKLSPVDVAALFGHIGCVQLLLDFWQVQRSNKTKRRNSISTSSMYLSLACQVNSPNALRLLIKQHSDKKEALECAIRLSAPECVEVVLQESEHLDMKKAFQGMSLFHVLYCYNSCLTVVQYEAMVDITSILIKYNKDVNALKPSRTFPLYSLLSHTMAGTTIAECSSYLLTCILILLQAGADPNMDEILLENSLLDSEQNVAFGRKPYSTAINCLLSNLPVLKFNAFQDETMIEPIENFACKGIVLLLNHGADLTVTRKFCTNPYDYGLPSDSYHHGTALHLMIATRSQCPVSHQILQLILHHGIDADTRGIWHMPESLSTLQYAVNILPFSLWTMALAVPISQMDKYIFTPIDFDMFQYIIKFMSQNALVLAYSEFLDTTEILRTITKVSGKMDILEKIFHQGNNIYNKIIAEFERGTREPWLLQRWCAHTVWKSCRMHIEKVKNLPIPGPLRKVILNFY